MRLLGHRESLNATYSRIRMWELETHLQRRCSTPTDPTVLVTRPRHPWETMEPLTVSPMVHQTQGLNSRENHCLNQGDLQLETISELRQIRSQNQFFSRRRTKLIKSRLFPTWLAAASKWEVHKRKIMPSNLEHLLSLSRKEVWTNQITDWLPRGKRLLRPTQIEPCLLRLLPESALATPNRCPLLGRRLDSWIPQLGRKRMWSHIQSHANHRFHLLLLEHPLNHDLLILRTLRWRLLRTSMVLLKTLANRLCWPLEVWEVTHLDLLLWYTRFQLDRTAISRVNHLSLTSNW